MQRTLISNSILQLPKATKELLRKINIAALQVHQPDQNVKLTRVLKKIKYCLHFTNETVENAQ